MTASAYPRHGWAVTVARRIPPIVLEQPWAIFIKSLCILTGLTAFVGPAPGSISSAFPQAVQWLWAGTLVLGALCALIGLLRPSLRSIEIAGLIWLGTAALVYALAVLLRFRADGLVAGGIILGFGLAALVRALAVYVTLDIARRAVPPPRRRRP